MTVKDLKSYQILNEKHVKELNSDGILLEHKKTGARVFLLSNDDENKVFCIGFRTPPSDSTGVPHIMEHSVLCGSAKFPVKDPFVELVKGSLNTFLNAMTYPDKTVYPVASCNDKDFQNLMDVYMDAVLHPNIYKEEKIFRQEGWHYEMESADSPITVNGVVYNEMKGAFSSPEGVLDRYTQNTLYPDICYTHESGGAPEVIPELTYEDFLNFHRKFYHPSNSFIYLYGNMDMAEKLDWLDREYLSHYDRQPVDSEIHYQKPFDAPKDREIFYPITEDEPEDHATYLSVNTVVGDDLDPILYMAFQILEYVLLDAPGAILKKELISAGIGQDILGSYENGILQPYFSVIAKNADGSQKEAFLKTVKGTLKKLADDGINQKSLLAGINYYEFRSREADFGNAPKGLMYGLQCLDSWLYGGDPLMHLEYEETFAFLKKAAKEGYFEELIRKYLLDNPFEAVITVSPKRGLTAIEDEKLREKLEAYKKSLGAEEIQAIVDGTKELKEYQDTPSPKEDLEKIPLLKRSDIRKEAEKFILTEREISGTKVLAHELFTSGIGYLRVMFRTDRVPSRALPYVIVVIVALLAGLLFWGVYSGEISNLRMPWSAKEDSSSSVSTADKADKKTDDTSKDAKTENKKSEDGKKTSTSDGQSKDASDANQNAEQNNDQNNGQDAASEQSVNLATEIRVVNATSITGYAKSKADALTQAGYTSVTPSNPTGNVPSQTVVWYQNEADKATAENVAQTLGISNVQQSSGLVTPIVVVLLN